MLSVNFFLRGSEKNTNPDKEFSVSCQLSIEGMERDVPFVIKKMKVPHKYWWSYNNRQNREQPTRNWINPEFHLAEFFNKQLTEIQVGFQKIHDAIPLFFPGEESSYKRLRELYSGNGIIEDKKEVVVPAFLDVFDEMVEDKINRKGIEKGTKTNYQNRRKNYVDFLKFKGYHQKFKIDKVDYDFVSQLETWMMSQKKLIKDRKKGEIEVPRFGIEYINKHLNCLKQTVEFALKKRYIKHLTVGKLDLTNPKPKPPKYILPEYRKKLMDCKYSSLQTARDIAVFLMHSGLSYIDYCTITDNDLIVTDLGMCIRKGRQKSEIYSMPVLLPECIEIINKYGAIAKLPRPHLNDINDQLKILGDVCGVNEETVGFSLSTSVFRETFASMMQNEYDIRNDVLKVMMGHTNTKQLDTYSRMLPNTVLREVQKVMKN